MADFTTHLLYSEFGADIEDTDTEYDPVSKVLVYAFLKLHFPLNNTTITEVFTHRAGQPIKTVPDHVVHNLNKGEGVAISQEGTGLRVTVNGHSTRPEDRHPDGSRLTTLETVTIPNVFV